MSVSRDGERQPAGEFGHHRLEVVTTAGRLLQARRVESIDRGEVEEIGRLLNLRKNPMDEGPDDGGDFGFL